MPVLADGAERGMPRFEVLTEMLVRHPYLFPSRCARSAWHAQTMDAEAADSLAM
jgi:hypothetical protein